MSCSDFPSACLALRRVQKSHGQSGRFVHFEAILIGSMLGPWSRDFADYRFLEKRNLLHTSVRMSLPARLTRNIEGDRTPTPP